MLRQALPLASPPWKKGGRQLESLVRKALYRFQMVEGVSHLGIALSGGKDSLSLLFLLKAISGRGFPPFALTAFHIGGEFSCGAGVEQAYLEQVCTALEIPLVIRFAEQKRETLECYSCSRIRRRLLFEAAKERGIDTLAFGHHRDDNIQTLLLNLLHKGEFAGMLPKLHMEAYGITLLRPLIFVAEREILLFAKEHGFARITCQCPVGQSSKRKVVDTLISEWEEHFPHIRSNLSQAALVYGSDKASRATLKDSI